MEFILIHIKYRLRLVKIDVFNFNGKNGKKCPLVTNIDVLQVYDILWQILSLSCRIRETDLLLIRSKNSNKNFASFIEYLSYMVTDVFIMILHKSSKAHNGKSYIKILLIYFKKRKAFNQYIN